MSWFTKLGYASNPLSIRPSENSNLFGYEKIIDRLQYQLRIGNVIFLQGSYGTGKSSILRFIRTVFKDNVLYHNCSSNVDLKMAIMNARPFWKKLLMMKPTKMILLLDEAHLTNPKDFDFLYEYYIMDTIKSIVFAGTDFDLVHFNKAFKSDTRIYELNEIKNSIATSILAYRMPEQKLISGPLARKVFLASDSNPRQYLQNLEDIFRRLDAMGGKRVVKKDIDDFFAKKKNIGKN